MDTPFRAVYTRSKRNRSDQAHEYIVVFWYLQVIKARFAHMPKSQSMGRNHKMCVVQRDFVGSPMPSRLLTLGLELYVCVVQVRNLKCEACVFAA